MIGQTIDFARLAGVFVARFGWRMTRGRALLASLVHRALYTLIAATLVLGLTNVWVRGDMIFNLFQITPFDPSNQGLRHMIGGWYALAANAILIVAGLHAAAALFASTTSCAMGCCGGCYRWPDGCSGA